MAMDGMTDYVMELERRDQSELAYRYPSRAVQLYICPVCGQLVSGDFKFCRQCGQRLRYTNDYRGDM